MKRFVTKALLLGLALSLTFASCKKEQYTLEYKVAKGDTFKQLVVATTKMSIQGMNTTNAIEMTLNNEVMDVQDNAITVETQYDRASMAIDMGMMKLSFNSDDTVTIASVDNLSPLLRAITAKPVAVTFSRQGIVEKVSGLEQVEASLIDLFDANDTLKNIAVESITKLFGSNALKATIERFTSIYPNHPVAVGESWNISLKSKGVFSATINDTMTLREVKGNIAIIDCKGAIEVAASENTQKQGQITVETTLSGTQIGTFTVDLTTGWVTESEVTQQLTGTMKAMQPGMETPMEMPASGTIILKQSRVK